MFARNLRIALVLFIGFTVLLGLAYPAVITGIARLSFSDQAEGSLISGNKNEIMGSDLIGQNFTGPHYMWGRLSATGPVPYNAGVSSGSNWGVNAPALQDSIKARVAALHAADPDNTLPIPVDLVTASGSGLDPHISVAAADYQAARVARVRSISLEAVQEAIRKSTEKRQFGIFGEDRVNVLRVNLILDGKI
ncbi:MAG: potassium-transporting ATPase subunit KdpC [Pseudobdellovibrionaceae bacterium]